MAGEPVVVDGIEYTPEEHAEMEKITETLLDTREKSFDEKEEKEAEAKKAAEDGTKGDDEKKEKEPEAKKEVADEKEVEPETKKDEDAPAVTEQTSEEKIKDEAYEALARTMGWRPKDEFDGGEGKEFIDAKQFILNAPEIAHSARKENKRLAKEVTDIKKILVSQTKHQNALFDARYKAELDKLKEDKKEAIRAGEVEEVEQIETKIEEIQKEADSTKTEETPEVDPLIVEWQDKNTWYTTDGPKTAYANAIIDKWEKSGGAHDEDLLKLIDKEMEVFSPKEPETKAVEEPKKEEEKKAEEQKKKQPQVATVESTVNQNKTNTAKKFTYEDLSAEAKRVCDNMVDAIEGYSRQEYVDELVETGVLK